MLRLLDPLDVPAGLVSSVQKSFPPEKYRVVGYAGDASGWYVVHAESLNGPCLTGTFYVGDEDVSEEDANARTLEAHYLFHPEKLVTV